MNCDLPPVWAASCLSSHSPPAPRATLTPRAVLAAGRAAGLQQHFHPGIPDQFAGPITQPGFHFTLQIIILFTVIVVVDQLDSNTLVQWHFRIGSLQKKISIEITQPLTAGAVNWITASLIPACCKYSRAGFALNVSLLDFTEMRALDYNCCKRSAARLTFFLRHTMMYHTGNIKTCRLASLTSSSTSPRPLTLFNSETQCLISVIHHSMLKPRQQWQQTASLLLQCGLCWSGVNWPALLVCSSPDNPPGTKVRNCSRLQLISRTITITISPPSITTPPSVVITRNNAR